MTKTSNKQGDLFIEALKQANRAWIIYTIFIIYSILTIIGTSDRQILLNQSVRLPILNSEVSLNGYFLINPLLSIILFIYFHLQLNILRREIDSEHQYLPVTERKFYPWIVLVAEEPDYDVYGWIQKIFVSVSIWWSLPILLILNAIWIIRKHNSFLSYSVSFISLFGIFIFILFWLKYNKMPIREIFRKQSILFPITTGLIIIFYISLIIILIPWVGKGRHFGFWSDYYRPPYSPGIFERGLNYFLFFDFRREVLSVKPSKDYQGIYWVNLSNTHLEGADLSWAILKRADLRNSYLQKANLISADLSGANLSGANLYNAWLLESTLINSTLDNANLAGILARGINLQNASISQSNLDGTDLSGANLKNTKLYQSNFENSLIENASFCKSDLRGGNFRRSNLQYSDFKGADLENAWFDEADLRNVKNLTVHQISKVKTLYKTKMDNEFQNEIKRLFPKLFEKPIEMNRPKIKFDKIFPGWDKGKDWSQISKF
jgi:uncharacterized protein YjbI with pentapeptide repeats